MSYDVDALIAKFRSEMEDTVQPYLWSEDEVTDYLDEAEDEFCQRVDALADTVTLSYTAGDDFIDLPAYVTRVRQARNPSKRPLQLFNAEQWDEAVFDQDYGFVVNHSNWDISTGPEVKALITDLKSGEVRLYPIPTVDGTVECRVYRRPLKPLGDRGKFEVTDRQHQRCMLLKAKALAYRKHDAEAFNPNLAAELEQQFDAQTEEIKSRVARSRRRAGEVRYGGL